MTRTIKRMKIACKKVIPAAKKPPLHSLILWTEKENSK